MYFAATPPIHGFRPTGAAHGVQIRSSRICRAARCACKIAPSDFVFRASCPPPSGRHFVRAKSLPAILSNLLSVLIFTTLSYIRSSISALVYGWAGRIIPYIHVVHPSGRTSCVQIRSRRICRPLIGSHCYHFSYKRSYTSLYMAGPGGLLRSSCLRPSGRTSCVQIRSRRICRTSYRFSLLPLSSINAHIHQRLYLAGPGGFEPPNARIKTWCLTAWRRPNINTATSVTIATRHSEVHARIPSSLTRLMPYHLATAQYKYSYFRYHRNLAFGGSCQDPIIINPADALPPGDGPI